MSKDNQAIVIKDLYYRILKHQKLGFDSKVDTGIVDRRNCQSESDQFD